MSSKKRNIYEAMQYGLGRTTFTQDMRCVRAIGSNGICYACAVDYLLAEVGLNIHEAHAFSTVDGYSLDVFVVDGWPYEKLSWLNHCLPSPLAVSEQTGVDNT